MDSCYVPASLTLEQAVVKTLVIIRELTTNKTLSTASLHLLHEFFRNEIEPALNNAAVASTTLLFVSSYYDEKVELLPNRLLTNLSQGSNVGKIDSSTICDLIAIVERSFDLLFRINDRTLISYEDLYNAYKTANARLEGKVSELDLLIALVEELNMGENYCGLYGFVRLVIEPMVELNAYIELQPSEILDKDLLSRLHSMFGIQLRNCYGNHIGFFMECLNNRLG